MSKKIALYRLEQKIWRAWRRRYGVQSLSTYEKTSRQSTLRAIAGVTFSQLVARVRKAPIVVFGDDRWVMEDRVLIARILRQSGMNRSNAIFLTDRTQEKNEKWPNSGLPIRRLRSSSTLEKMDRSIVNAALIEANRGKRVVIWTGALRATPAKIPRHIRRRGISPVTVLLESPEARWKSPISSDWGRGSEDHFALLHRSPLLGVERYRGRVEGGSSLAADRLPMEFENCVRDCVRIFHGKIPPRRTLLISPFDERSLEKFLKAKLDHRVRYFLEERLLRGESAVLPRERIVLLSTLDRGHVAEEAAHYARLAPKPVEPVGPIQVTVEEAFGFLGSLCSDPNRSIPKAGARRTVWEEVHQTGYRLGRELATVFKSSSAAQKKIRKLWRVVPQNEVEAFWLLTQLTEIVR